MQRYIVDGQPALCSLGSWSIGVRWRQLPYWTYELNDNDWSSSQRILFDDASSQFATCQITRMSTHAPVFMLRHYAWISCCWYRSGWCSTGFNFQITLYLFNIAFYKAGCDHAMGAGQPFFYVDCYSSWSNCLFVVCTSAMGDWLAGCLVGPLQEDWHRQPFAFQRTWTYASGSWMMYTARSSWSRQIWMIDKDSDAKWHFIIVN